MLDGKQEGKDKSKTKDYKRIFLSIKNETSSQGRPERSSEIQFRQKHGRAVITAPETERERERASNITFPLTHLLNSTFNLPGRSGEKLCVGEKMETSFEEQQGMSKERGKNGGNACNFHC